MISSYDIDDDDILFNVVIIWFNFTLNDNTYLNMICIYWSVGDDPCTSNLCGVSWLIASLTHSIFIFTLVGLVYGFYINIQLHCIVSYCIVLYVIKLNDYDFDFDDTCMIVSMLMSLQLLVNSHNYFKQRTYIHTYIWSDLTFFIFSRITSYYIWHDLVSSTILSFTISHCTFS